LGDPTKGCLALADFIKPQDADLPDPLFKRRLLKGAPDKVAQFQAAQGRFGFNSLEERIG